VARQVRAGNDSLFGDLDDADLWCPSGAGAPGAGNGSPARDVILGGRGDDLMLGNGGNDTLYGAVGADDMNGGDGNDVLYGMLDGDFLTGGDGNDILRGGEGPDAFIADDGQTDALHGGDGCDAANGRVDSGIDVLSSIEHPNDLCPLEP
jgi:Ca2+-binding RTX toxin-like protein